MERGVGGGGPWVLIVCVGLEHPGTPAEAPGALKLADPYTFALHSCSPVAPGTRLMLACA